MHIERYIQILTSKKGIQTTRVWRKKLRLAIRKLHLFIGLSAGLMFVFLGLSGGLLVFEHEIDEWLNPALLTHNEGGEAATLDAIVAAAMRFDTTFTAERLDAPRTESGVYLVRGKHRVGADLKPLDVYVDPVEAIASGARVWGEYPMSFIYKLHYTLLMGKFGKTLIGIAGFLLFVMTLSGIWLWWPKKGKWKQAIGVKWRAKNIRIIWDLHRSLGFFSSFVLAAVSISGFYMIFPEYVRPAVNVFSTITPAPSGLRSVQHSDLPALSLSQVEKVADKIFPETQLKRIYFPQGSDGVYRVIKRQKNAAIKSGGYSQVWLDQYSGKVLAQRSAETFTRGDYFIALQFPLHNGEIFGLFGRLLILIASVMPGVLLLTGFLMWNRKRQS